MIKMNSATNLWLFSDRVKARDMNRADSAFDWLDKGFLEKRNKSLCYNHNIQCSTENYYLFLLQNEPVCHSAHCAAVVCSNVGSIAQLKIWINYDAFQWSMVQWRTIVNPAINLLRRCGRTSRRKRSTCSNNQPALKRVEKRGTFWGQEVFDRTGPSIYLENKLLFCVLI